MSYVEKLHLYLLGFVLLGSAMPGLVLSADFGRTVPAGAQSGDLQLQPCQIVLPGDDQSYAGDCGTLVVPEYRRNPDSRLIALPVRRIKSASAEPLAPIFWFEGGPGGPNRIQYATDGLIEKHDFVMVGYRGIEGQVHLECPEISDAIRSVRGEYLGNIALTAYGQAASACGERIKSEGIDLDGYSMNQTIDDNEAARKAMGYEQINLFGNSYGTRLQMLYQWRYPDNVHRSVMVAVNPPGHFIFDSMSLESLLIRYSKLCARNSHCSARTTDLYSTLQRLGRHLPESWMGIDIDPQLVKLITSISLHESIQLPGEPPLNGPAAIDMWLDAAEGDASGMALVSVVAPYVLPEAFEWGHFLAMGASAPDFTEDDRDYKTELTPDTIIGSPLSLLVWSMAVGWPATEDQSVDDIPDSDIETLLISGSLDGSTPMQHAREELMPHLPNGRQLVIEEQAHTETFWHSQPQARSRLLQTFFTSGVVDDSRYEYQRLQFATESSWGKLAKMAVATVILFVIVIVMIVTVIVRKRVRILRLRSSRRGRT